MTRLVTYQVEQWADCWHETAELWTRHWDEVALDKEQIPLDPDLAQYEAFAANGELHIVTVRVDSRLVGYHASIVRRHLHYKGSLNAFTDVYFLLPEYRQGLLGVKLFRKAEETLKARGVEKIFTGTKVHLNMSKMFEHLGYRQTEILFTKYIGGD